MDSALSPKSVGNDRDTPDQPVMSVPTTLDASMDSARTPGSVFAHQVSQGSSAILQLPETLVALPEVSFAGHRGGIANCKLGAFSAYYSKFFHSLTTFPKGHNLSNKLRARTWALSRLRRAGMNEGDLVKVYKTIIRAVAEYAVVAWH